MPYLRADWLKLKLIIGQILEETGAAMVEVGDYVKISGGYVLGEETFITPIPATLAGAIALVVPTGRVITETVSPGQSWGSYEHTALDTPVAEIRLKVVSCGDWKERLLEVDGLMWTKLTPLEALAAQALGQS